MRNWESIRSTDGRGARIMYAPEWSKTLPYVTYIGGTAGRHFASFNAAVYYMRQRGYHFK